jgi:glyoxylase-like metal-dependent hydrolase (beta-lactamase superfamily II)
MDDAEPRILDLRFQGRQGAIAAHLLSDGADAALIEAGPSTTAETLLSELAGAGVPREVVTKILLTHIHLDHAGAAGTLSTLLPNAAVYVHPAGYRHLIDPSRLVRSAARIYGDRMDALWGAVLPVPEHRLVAVRDGDRIAAGGRELVALHTPGHAAHHVAYWDRSPGYVYTGDVAGIRVPGLPFAVPPTPAPDLDLEAWSRSLDRLLGLDARALYLTHFGPVAEVGDHLHELRERLLSWRDLADDALRDGHGAAGIALLLEESIAAEAANAGADPTARARLGLVSGNEMNAAGLVRYLRTRREAIDGPPTAVGRSPERPGAA